MDTTKSLAHLRIAITGGTSGLGLALVEKLSQQGARVAFVARRAKLVREVAGRTGAHGIDGDVSRKEQIHGLALRLTSELDGVDILINNASSLGPVPLALLADTECEDFEEALATNLLGPFRLTKAVLGSLAASAREGRPAWVINITSDAAVTPYAGWGAYGASKAALSHMSRIWNEELKEHGIRVADFEPGDMDTPLHAQAIPDADPAELKHPADSAEELIDWLASAIHEEVAA